MKWTSFRGCKLFYRHADAMQAMCQQADAFEAFFTPRSDEALIVDCGSNIGVTMLDWRARWPHAKIICIEPDPHAFALLNKNVEANDLPSVRLIAAAVSDTQGEAMFYGDLSASADARGNSLSPAWGQRPGTSAVPVACRRLSSIIGDNRVDFLKLDIEGSEQAVLMEIEPQLSQIDAIYAEVHETAAGLATNNVAAIVSLLERAGFVVQCEARNASSSLPAHLNSWQSASGATQTQLLCWRKSPPRGSGN